MVRKNQKYGSYKKVKKEDARSPMSEVAEDVNRLDVNTPPRQDMKKTRRVHPEMSFMNTEEAMFFDTMVITHGARKLIEHKAPAILERVHAFYEENTEEVEDGLYWAPIPGVGYQPIVSLAIIREYYGLPLYDSCAFQEGRDSIDLTCRLAITSHLSHDTEKTEWFQRVAGEGNTWYIRRRSLSVDARIWLDFVLANVIPSRQSSNIPDYIAFLVYCLSTGAKVSLEALILESITAAVKNQSLAMVFPHLISDRYRILGAPELRWPHRSYPRAFNLEWIRMEFRTEKKSLPTHALPIEWKEEEICEEEEADIEKELLAQTLMRTVEELAKLRADLDQRDIRMRDFEREMEMENEYMHCQFRYFKRAEERRQKFEDKMYEQLRSLKQEPKEPRGKVLKRNSAYEADYEELSD